MSQQEPGTEDHPKKRPHSAQSTLSSHSSGSSSKHVKCIGRYVLTGQNLGKGNFARVEAAVHTLTRAKVAVKIIETDQIKEEYVRKNLLREAQLMRRLRHPNIIRLYETMKTNNIYCLITEIAEGGELLSYVRNDFNERRLPEATTRPFIRQLTSALFYLHSNGIVHRDLKMENILLDKRKRNVKIVDFGLSNAQKAGALLQTHCGSPEYAAPELFIPGRQYGPEVDVWSLGVNMYAMLVGKLPFRSPRQGAKKRQKLLEQISGGMTEGHEQEMIHLSTGARDLICHLLQPDASRRATLDEVMHHPWVTKDGTHPLTPYEYSPPDPITQNMVMELMQKVLGEPVSQIKENVKRDRCDWLAAIYNLLMDQSEGRNILQRMLTDDPTLLSATEYHNTVEHLSLSQSQGQSQQSEDSQDATGILTKPSLSVTKQKHHRKSQDEKDKNDDILDSDVVKAIHGTKNEHRKHPTADHRTLGQLRGHGNHQSSSGHTHHVSYNSRRLSVEVSPHHPSGHMTEMGVVVKRHARLPNEEAHYHSHLNYQSGGYSEPPSRPHSRMSAPEPLPIPFQRSFLPKNHFHYNHSPHRQSPTESPPHSKSPVHSLSQPQSRDGSPRSLTSRGSKRRTNVSSNLKPAMRKSLSASVETQIDSSYYGNPWKGKTQVAPIHRRLSAEGTTATIGWSNQAHFGSSQKIPSVGKIGPAADIQSLIPTEETGVHTQSPKPTLDLDTLEIKHSMSQNKMGVVTPPLSSSRKEITTDRLKIDMLPIDENTRKNFRSTLTKTPQLHNSLIITGQIPGFSASGKHLEDLDSTPPINSLKPQAVSSTHTTLPHRELPSLDIPPMLTPPKSEKSSPTWKRKSIGGIFNKARKIKNNMSSNSRATSTSGRSSLLVHGSTPNDTPLYMNDVP